MKRISFLFLLIISFAVSSHAQEISGMNIEVTANVIESIELTTLQNMQFDDIQPGQEELSISPILDPNAGRMVAKGIPDARIRLSYLKEWTLTNDRDNSTLTFYYQLSGNDLENQSNSELLQANNRNLQFNSEGEYFIWIGGSVNISNAQPGNYEGEFTIEIEYI